MILTLNERFDELILTQNKRILVFTEHRHQPFQELAQILLVCN